MRDCQDKPTYKDNLVHTKVYAVYDNKAEAFMQPFFADTPGIATRNFQTNVNSEQSIFNKYPNDFVLYEIGVFDDAKGLLIAHDHNINLGMATDYIKPDNVRQINGS